VIEATGADGLAIDSDAESILAARTNASARLPDGSYEFRAADAQQSLNEDAFDLAVCIGSTHAFGTGDAAYPNTIQRLKELVRPGGQLLIGEGFWKQPPAPVFAVDR
jgi:cyclopropane fatty-acyl-phospholipid synthase-like methyltransferase